MNLISWIDTWLDMSWENFGCQVQYKIQFWWKSQIWMWHFPLSQKSKLCIWSISHDMSKCWSHAMWSSKLKGENFSKILDEMNSSLAGSIVPWIGLGGEMDWQDPLDWLYQPGIRSQKSEDPRQFSNHLWKRERLSAWYDDNDLYFLQWQRLG